MPDFSVEKIEAIADLWGNKGEPPWVGLARYCISCGEDALMPEEVGWVAALLLSGAVSDWGHNIPNNTDISILVDLAALVFLRLVEDTGAEGRNGGL